MSKLTSEKKKILRKWVFDIGYDKAMESLKKEHDDIFLALGNKDGKYNKDKIERFEEIVDAIKSVEFLKKFKAEQLSFFV